jgi:hypothetical protein
MRPPNNIPHLLLSSPIRNSFPRVASHRSTKWCFTSIWNDVSLTLRFAAFTNCPTTFALFLYFLLPFFLLSFTNWTTSRRSFPRIPRLVSALGKPAYESDIGSHQPDTFFLGAFAKLRKATISFVMSVCPSVRPSVCMEQPGSHWTVFHEMLYFGFSKICPENPISLISHKTDGNFT